MILILLKQAFTAIHATSEALVEKPPFEVFSVVEIILANVSRWGK